MAKQPSAPSANPPPRLCPTCGTRVGDLATKCIVCGAELSGPAASTTKPQRQWRSLLPQRPTFGNTSARPPQAQAGQTAPTPPAPAGAPQPGPAPMAASSRRGAVTIPLPGLIALVLLIVVLGIGGTVLVLNSLGVIETRRTEVPTAAPSLTPSPTFTLAPTATYTPQPTPTPLPPAVYTVVANDSCISIAVRYNISLQALLDANGLPQACPLNIGQKLQVPQPTYTPTAPATATLEAGALTETARPRQTYKVVAGDTLFSVAAKFNVDYQALAADNGIPGPDYPITVGQTLQVPLDRPPPTAGPSPTATPLPPYPAPALLSPANGSAVSPVEQTVVLQWAAVDVLKDGEVYLVTVEDVTCNCARKVTDVTTQTRYIVKPELKPIEAQPHVFRWAVVTARQNGTRQDGTTIYEPAGATSEQRTFTWTGIGAPNPTATPSP
jgi:LysM repeat protein